MAQERHRWHRALFGPDIQKQCADYKRKMSEIDRRGGNQYSRRGLLQGYSSLECS